MLKDWRERNDEEYAVHNNVIRAGEFASGNYELDLTPETAGWQYSGLKVLRLDVDESVEVKTAESEMIVLPLAGSVTLEIGDESIALFGRDDVWSGISDFAYVPRDSTVVLTSPQGGRYALLTAWTDEVHPVQRFGAHEVPVTIRGRGVSTRQINDFGKEWLKAGRILACEGYIPSGNWSSYPPHKHDETTSAETALEEIYYFEIPDGPSGPGFAYQQVYGTIERPIDVLTQVWDRDVVLVPHGWHGPTIASPANPVYFLNVMAGPSPDRAWRVCNDPSHEGIRELWKDQEIDGRVPLVDANGRVPDLRATPNHFSFVI